MKKLLNILSLLTLTSLTTLSTIACTQQNNTFQISFAQKEHDVVQAINETQDKQSTTNFNLLSFNDILDKPIINNSNLNNKHEVVFTYDLKIKQDADTFLNNNFTYRIPEVSGNFTLNLDNNVISNNNITKITYLVGNYQNYINNIDNILTGSTNDFTLIMNPTGWENNFLGAIQENHVDTTLKFLNIYNSNIILSNDDWKNILYKLKNKIGTWDIIGNYVICLHVININNVFKIAFTNLNSNGSTSMNSLDTYGLPLCAFSSVNDVKDGSVLTKGNKFIGLNKDVLKELTDIYTDNSYYHNSNWNIKTINQLLQTNHFCNINLDLKTVATCLFNNWNINLVNNFLASNHEYFLMQYDSNNNYIKNNWNM